MVSICCITYNHEHFIHETIEGFLKQTTKFPVEIIIHDDASTDGTALIIQNYANRFPELIVPLFQKENQFSKGIKPSPTFVWPMAKGKYIALCEGDDFWTDPLKLQKQVDFLEANPQFSACAHKVNILFEDPFDRNIYFFNDDIKDFNTALQYFYPTCSIVFRKQCLDKEAFRFLTTTRITGGDKLLLMVLFKHGKLKFFNHEMATYRKHKGGLSHFSDSEKNLREKLLFINAADHYFNRKYRKILNTMTLISYGRLAVMCKNSKEVKPSLRFMFCSFSRIRSFKDLKIFTFDVFCKFFLK